MKKSRDLRPLRATTARAGVLVLDVLSDFRYPRGRQLLVALARRAGRLGVLLRRARDSGVPVFYVSDYAVPWRSDGPALVRSFEAAVADRHPQMRHLVPAKDDSVVLKPRHSAFFGTPLEVLLQDRSIGTLILAGTSTESCVWMTACDAHVRGYELIVPKDVIAGGSDRAVRATLAGLQLTLRARTPARASTVRFRHGAVP